MSATPGTNDSWGDDIHRGFPVLPKRAGSSVGLVYRAFFQYLRHNETFNEAGMKPISQTRIPRA